jgi:endonuclease/exonuclease/phosphatase family metal-dependent hydrolase
MQSGQLCIGNVHLDYVPPIRASEINHCIRHLGSENFTASILCGDTNIISYDEITPLLDAGYLDAGAHGPLTDTGRAPDPTYGDFGIKIGNNRPAEGPSRRLDLVICRGLHILAYKLIGCDPIARKHLKGTGADKEKLMDVFPSDHAGVCVDVGFG